MLFPPTVKRNMKPAARSKARAAIKKRWGSTGHDQRIGRSRVCVERDHYACMGESPRARDHAAGCLCECHDEAILRHYGVDL